MNQPPIQIVLPLAQKSEMSLGVEQCSSSWYYTEAFNHLYQGKRRVVPAAFINDHIEMGANAESRVEEAEDNR